MPFTTVPPPTTAASATPKVALFRPATGADVGNTADAGVQIIRPPRHNCTWAVIKIPALYHQDTVCQALAHDE